VLPDLVGDLLAGGLRRFKAPLFTHGVCHPREA
jgi:hypothetical protein